MPIRPVFTAYCELLLFSIRNGILFQRVLHLRYIGQSGEHMSKTQGVESRRKLTDSFIAKGLPAESERYEVSDSDVLGLRVAIHPTGKRSFVLRYRFHGLSRIYTIGNSDIGIKKAREIAKKKVGDIADGIDPGVERKEEKAQNEARRADEIGAAMREFMAKHVATRKGKKIRLTTRIETARLLGLRLDGDGKWIENDNGVLSHWNGRSIASITKAQVQALLDDIAIKQSDGRGGPIAANRTAAALRLFFGWLKARDRLVVSPCEGINDPQPEEPRDRVLSNPELAALWKAADRMAYPFGRMVQLLILTGCRRDEVREAQWPEFNLKAGKWTIPAARTKNGNEHAIPLSDSMVAILEGLPRIQGKFVFTTTGNTPISGQTKAVKRLREEIERKLGGEIERWTLHDCRRTFATGLQRLGFPVEVAEACLNHLSGTRAGVAGIYGRHDYSAEKRAAFDAWAREVERIATGRTAAVIQMPRA
jgi:integrase